MKSCVRNVYDLTDSIFLFVEFDGNLIYVEDDGKYAFDFFLLNIKFLRKYKLRLEVYSIVTNTNGH